ncbi:MAG: copper oxidase, partial [Planctomycetes bacterium]|nr:copper oxidase [Planctomycetota bacterium]
MASHNTRRRFLKHGAAVTAGMLAAAGASGASAQEQTPSDPPSPSNAPGAVESNRELPERFRGYSRTHPSYGGPVGSDNYLGKLVSGLRGTGLPPVPFEMPDVGKIPWKMVDGRKEYHIYCQHVRRELLPNNWMDFFGYNGSMPGPTIEAAQGDKVRLVVHNQLPEPTTIHWHGFELPNEMDGVPGLTQDPIMPGDTFTYEFDLHQAGTFFYHSHFPMQEAFGMAGFFIIHPAAAWDPPVDRDFGLMFQNFHISQAQTVPDSMAMDFNWHTINGRSGPYTTPLVCKLGERIRIRILNFSPQQHHPIHLHGHTFWITGHEGARIPSEAWVPRNNELIAVAQATDLEFIAFNPGDWLIHCHMVHHMMNHMVRQVGPRIRKGSDVGDYKMTLGKRPRVDFVHEDKGFRVPGYPQKMQGMEMTEDEMHKIQSRREVQGMRKMWHMGVHGLMTVI